MAGDSGRYKTLKTFHDFEGAEQWLQRNSVKNSRQNSKQKRIALEQFDAFLYEMGLDIEDVGNDELEMFSIWLDDEADMAHSSLPHRWYAVRAYLNAHVDAGLGYLDADDEHILQWVDSGTKTTQEKDTDIHWLEQDKIAQLIEGAKNLKNRLVIELLWHTGCRPSEVARMKLRRHDAESRSIKVQTSKIQDTDADNYERTVFYGLSMRRTMTEWLELGGRKARPFADESPYLVVGYNTPGISSRRVNKIVRLAAEEAGIQEEMIETSDGTSVNRVTPKTLRHSFAVHSVRGREQSGSPPIDLERLRRLMGHSSLETTRSYLKYRTSDLKAAYDSCHPG